MAVLKVIKLMADSSKGWEDATQQAVSRAAKTVKGIRSVWIKDMSATVDKSGKIAEYRVICHVSFEVR